MLRRDPTRTGLIPGRQLTAWWVAGLAMWGLAWGSALEGVLEVRSA